MMLLGLGLGLVAAAVYVVTAQLDGPDAGQPDVVAMPYPRTSKPLPVPEVRIGQGPWQDPLPSAAPLRVPQQVPKFAEGLKCTTVYPPDAKGQGGTFRACQTD